MSDSDERERSDADANGTDEDAKTPEGEKRDLPSWNRGRTKKRKQKDDEEDAFQKGMKTASRSAANRWPMVVGGLVGAVAIIGGIVYFTQSRQAGSAEATRVLADAAAYEARARIGDAEAMFGARKTPPPQPVAESEEARDELVSSKLEELAGMGGTVDLDAELIRARRSLMAGDAAAALEHYDTFLAKASTSHPLHFAAQEGRAVALEDAERLDDALAAYETLAGKKNSFYRDMALWHQGRLLERMDRRDDALAIYKQYLEEFPFTEHSLAREQVRGRLQELDPKVLEEASAADADASNGGASVPPPTGEG